MNRAILAAAFVAVLVAVPATAQDESARDALERGNANFHAGAYEDARQSYEAASAANPRSAIARFNLGTAAYRLGNYVQAQEAFVEALDGDDPRLASRSQYNLGNVMYQRALYAMQAFRDPVGPLRAATAHYRKALALDADFLDARYNLELAHRLLRRYEGDVSTPRANPREREPGTTDSKGLSEEDDRALVGSPSEREAHAGRTRALLERLHRLAQITDAPADIGAQAQAPVEPPPPMTEEEANELLDATREHAQAARDQRREARHARLREAAIDKIW